MAEPNKIQNKKGQASTGSAVPISDIFFMTIRHWVWILVSIAVFVGGAYFHLLRTPNVYVCAADLLIKESSKGQNTEIDALNDLGVIQTNTNIQNEILNFKSIDLMEDVVKRLGLDINYYYDGKFHDVVAYGENLPVKVQISDIADNASLSFVLNLDAQGGVVISGLGSADKVYKGKLNQAIATTDGKILVTPSDYYKKGESVEIKVNKIPLAAASGSYNGRLGVDIANEKVSVIRLSISDENIQRANDVLSTLINVYNENWIHDRNQVAVSTSNFISDRLNIIENELGNVDSDISSYKSATLTPDFDAAASMALSQSQQAQEGIVGINNQLSMARYIRSYITAAESHTQMLPTNGISSSGVSGLLGEYNAKMLHRNSLVAKSSEENPLVKQIDDELARQRQVIVRTIDNEILALNTQLKSLRNSESQAVSKLAASPNQAKNLLSVERQQKVKESLYLFLLQKREENELSQAFSAYNTRIVKRPGLAGMPTPNRRNILAMAFLIGLALPFGFTFVRETLNSKLRGRKDIEDLAVPFLGEIPLYSRNRRKGKYGRDVQVRAIVVKAGKRNTINEAFRVVCTNVEFMKINKGAADVIALTSFNPGSGKSFLTINLAVALALNKQRVLVIDGDMRHGSASAYVDSPSKGLSDVLSGNINNVRDVIVHDQNEELSLSMLPVGTVPPNPSELLRSARFGEVIASLREDYDYILIDCPPIEVVADAQIIDRQADRTVFVLRAGLFERSMVPMIDKIYFENKFKNMAVILNGTSSQKSRYGYSYGYGYGYGYGYNYGSSDESGKSKKSGKWQDS